MIQIAVVTGATGFIGGALAKQLLLLGTKVYAVDLDANKLAQLRPYGNVVEIVASFDDYQGLTAQIDDEIDVFYHFAFAGGFDGKSLKDYELQLKNTKAVCDAVMAAASLHAKRFVYASTVNELEAKDFLTKDLFEPRYSCIYSTTKLAAGLMGRTLAFNLSMEFTSGLIAMPFGEGNPAKTLPNVMMKQLMTGITPKLIEGNNQYDLVYIDDVAKAFVAIGERGVNFKSYYIGHRKLKTFRQIMTEIKCILAPNVTLTFGEYPDSLDLNYSLINLDALYNDTGFECEADFKESILKTAEWVKILEI